MLVSIPAELLCGTAETPTPGLGVPSQRSVLPVREDSHFDESDFQINSFSIETSVPSLRTISDDVLKVPSRFDESPPRSPPTFLAPPTLIPPSAANAMVDMKPVVHFTAEEESPLSDDHMSVVNAQDEVAAEPKKEQIDTVVTSMIEQETPLYSSTPTVKPGRKIDAALSEQLKLNRRLPEFMTVPKPDSLGTKHECVKCCC